MDRSPRLLSVANPAMIRQRFGRPLSRSPQSESHQRGRGRGSGTSISPEIHFIIDTTGSEIDGFVCKICGLCIERHDEWSHFCNHIDGNIPLVWSERYADGFFQEIKFSRE